MELCVQAPSTSLEEGTHPPTAAMALSSLGGMGTASKGGCLELSRVSGWKRIPPAYACVHMCVCMCTHLGLPHTRGQSTELTGALIAEHDARPHRDPSHSDGPTSITWNQHHQSLALMRLRGSKDDLPRRAVWCWLPATRITVSQDSAQAPPLQ